MDKEDPHWFGVTSAVGSLLEGLVQGAYLQNDVLQCAVMLWGWAWFWLLWVVGGELESRLVRGLGDESFEQLNKLMVYYFQLPD